MKTTIVCWGHIGIMLPPLRIISGFNVCSPLKYMEYGVDGDLTIIYPKPYAARLLGLGLGRFS